MSRWHIIDKAALAAISASALYLYFLNAWDNIPLAGVLAFACAALGGVALRALPPRRRMTMAQARQEVLRVASLPDAEAQEALSSLVRTRWPKEEFALAPVLKHPEATMSSGDVLNAWKANRDAARLVVAATCPAEPRALAYARELERPAVAVVDSRGLMRMLRRCLPAPEPAPRASLRQRLRRLAARMASGRVTLRHPLLALALLYAYLRHGGAPYLFAALAILAYAGVGVVQRRLGKQLFSR